jgi:hypothetical protein
MYVYIPRILLPFDTGYFHWNEFRSKDFSLW